MFKPGDYVRVKGKVEEVITTEQGTEYGIRVKGNIFTKVVVKEAEVEDYDTIT